jgi:Protein of unknown function (DUF2917)
MKPHTNDSATLQLSQGGLLSMKPTQCMQLLVLSGCVWVTQTKVERDHFLRAGHCLELTPGLLTVLTSEDDSRFVLEISPKKCSFYDHWMGIGRIFVCKDFLTDETTRLPWQHSLLANE